MGSLTSKPKAPTPSTQVIYVPAPVATAPSTPATPSTTESSKPDDKTAAEVRTSGLLSRDRSRFGTVVTSFRGLLGLADSSDKRKSLLGE